MHKLKSKQRFNFSTFLKYVILKATTKEQLQQCSELLGSANLPMKTKEDMSNLTFFFQNLDLKESL
jgi:hypothetical protein